MRLPSKLLMMSLPALAVLAACARSTYPPGPTVSSTVPPPAPSLVGALGAPIAPAMTAPLAGSTTAPAVQAVPGAPVRMSATDITGMLANNTAQGVTANGTPYAIYFSGNGQERFREGSFTDFGTWRVMPDGMLCSALTRVSNDNQECYIMYRSGNTITFERPDGITVGSVAVLPGNPQNL